MLVFLHFFSLKCSYFCSYKIKLQNRFKICYFYKYNQIRHKNIRIYRIRMFLFDEMNITVYIARFTEFSEFECFHSHCFQFF